MGLILGSSSFARQSLLKGLGITFTTHASSFDERSIPESYEPITYSKILASKKNEVLQLLYPNDVILTLDTIVYFEGKIFNKPQDYQDAFTMLKKMSGKKHQVITACCVYSKGKALLDTETTEVKFNLLSDEMIEIFLTDPHFIHRAGAYTLQGRGALLVESIQGSYENVIGFPFNTVEKLLNQFGETLWSQPS
jgi:septum formation protein